MNILSECFFHHLEVFALTILSKIAIIVALSNIWLKSYSLWVVGGLWVRLGKIKCAAKALACVSACSSFNFAKRWHFRPSFLSVCCRVVGRPTLAPNGKRIGEVADKLDEKFNLAVT